MHEATLDALLDPHTVGQPSQVPSPQLRARLLADLATLPDVLAPPSAAASARRAAALPADLPPLPPALSNLLLSRGAATWRTLVPGIRAIELPLPSAWRARLVRFRPGLTIPIHDHGGPEHTVVFSGGLVDAGGHLGRGDATTMFPGERHTQRTDGDEPCVALIINEAPAQPLTISGRFLKWVTRS
jgi:putative transcriptional regulator